ncbi:MAG TPA: hypothetical protein VMV46_07960 [Thermoanaerobaculia bacterium]|nr:hypothetical protein [Thermoanaerobaculia bacterium]
MTAERRNESDRPEPTQTELTQTEIEKVVGGLRLGGVKGESTDDKHKSEIDINS